MLGMQGTGLAIPVTTDEHEVGSLVERATRPGPGAALVPWSGPSGDSRPGGRGCEASTGPSGLRPGAVALSDARRLELSAGSARQGTVLVPVLSHHCATQDGPCVRPHSCWRAKVSASCSPPRRPAPSALRCPV